MQQRSTERNGRAAVGVIATLVLLSSLAVVPAATAWASSEVLASSQATPHFPLRCTTLITSGQISTILKRHVTTGRGNDLDAQSSRCFFDTFAGSSNDVLVEVDAYPSDLATTKKHYPGREVSTLNGLGTHVAVVTGMHVAQVFAIFGSWYLEVAGGTPISTHSYKATQMLAIAQRVHQDLARAMHVRASSAH
jgi:hypothetical protein